MSTTLQPPIQKYLEAFELKLKQHSGVSPEDAVSDAREFLHREHDALLRAEPGLDDVAVYEHFVDTFGPPKTVAAAYAESAGDGGRVFRGYAPGWRICCTKCGRSAPYARVGVRVLAASYHKYVLGYCSDCRWLRWMRVTKDLHRVNLTQRLGDTHSPEEVRRSMHRPWTVLILILALVLPLSMAWAFFTGKNDLPRVFQNLPDGWSVQKSITVPAAQRDDIARRMGGRIASLSNTVVAKQSRPIQINVVQCADDRSADRVQAAMLHGKTNKRLVHRADKTIYEFVARSQDEVLLALAARYELGIQPRSVTYRVTFDAAPVKSGDSMKWNAMFNAFLQMAQDRLKPEAQARIDELSKHFEFGDQLTLRRYGHGGDEIKWSFAPRATRTVLSTGGDLHVHRFSDLPRKAGVPFASVTCEVTSETHAFTPTERGASDGLTSATPDWPADDPRMQRLAAEITAGGDTQRDKVDALLRWLLPGRNINFDGPIVGSRYGVHTVVEQRFGHCWDFSDLFVTLCRASDVPCRQVLGWMHKGEGHVWAEVLIEGEGWKQVDPTAAAPCGSDYIPLVSTTDGRMPFVYVSAVQIEVVNNR